MSNREEHNKWVASGYVLNGFGKLAGSRYQYELSQIEEKKWKLWPVRLNDCTPIHGSTPKECLEAARKIDEPELEVNAACRRGEIRMSVGREWRQH